MRLIGVARVGLERREVTPVLQRDGCSAEPVFGMDAAEFGVSAKFLLHGRHGVRDWTPLAKGKGFVDAHTNEEHHEVTFGPGGPTAREDLFAHWLTFQDGVAQTFIVLRSPFAE